MNNVAIKLQKWCCRVWKENCNSDSLAKRVGAIGALSLSVAIDAVVLCSPVIIITFVMLIISNLK